MNRIPPESLEDFVEMRLFIKKGKKLYGDQFFLTTTGGVKDIDKWTVGEYVWDRIHKLNDRINKEEDAD